MGGVGGGSSLASRLLTLRRMNRGGFLAHPVHLPNTVAYACQRWFCPQAFDSFGESCFPVPHGTIQNLKNWFLWYLLLEVFTRTSFPARNPITSVFKVRCLSTTGFFKWLITLATIIRIPLLRGIRQCPNLKYLLHLGFVALCPKKRLIKRRWCGCIYRPRQG